MFSLYSLCSHFALTFIYCSHFVLIDFNALVFLHSLKGVKQKSVGIELNLKCAYICTLLSICKYSVLLSGSTLFSLLSVFILFFSLKGLKQKSVGIDINLKCTYICTLFTLSGYLQSVL